LPNSGALIMYVSANIATLSPVSAGELWKSALISGSKGETTNNSVPTRNIVSQLMANLTV
jgi:hypothetical protein